jgi:hypothetical protein
MAIIGCTPGGPAQTVRRTEMALDDDMTAPPEEPDSGTPADRAEGSIRKGDYLGGEEADDRGGPVGADGGADGGNDSDTESEDDPRLA